METDNRMCSCGARPDGTESEGTGNFVDDAGNDAWICLACWCEHNYGRKAIETDEDDMRKHLDPLTAIINLAWALALADHLGDIREDLDDTWSALGLGPIPEAEGGEPIEDEGDAVYDSGDILIREIEARHGVSGLCGSGTFEVTMRWTTEHGDQREWTCTVNADSPMDAARAAYLATCDEFGCDTLDYADAEVNGEEFELQPITCVMAVRKQPRKRSE